MREPWVWDAQTGQEIRSLKGHTSKVTSVGFSPNGKCILTGSHDATVKVWDAATGQEIRTLRGHLQVVRSVTFSRDGKLILTASEDGTVKVWSAECGPGGWALREDTGRRQTALLGDIRRDR